MTVLDYAVKAKERLDFEFPYDLKEWTENMNMLMENYHKHTTWSDLVQIDSATSMEEFIEYSKKGVAGTIFRGSMAIKENGLRRMIYVLKWVSNLDTQLKHIG